jgi:hypothetical protein
MQFLVLFLVTDEIVSHSTKAHVVVEVKLHPFLTSALDAGE